MVAALSTFVLGLSSWSPAVAQEKATLRLDWVNSGYHANDFQPGGTHHMSQAKARHAMDPAVAGMSLEEISRKYVARFGERKPDWTAFTDATIEGWRRAQHRFIGNTSGKPDDNVIPAKAFTLSIMYVPAGQGNAAHTHEVEEVFFVLQGHLMVFFEDEAGNRVETVLGPWDCASCPAGVIHGYHNNTLAPVYVIVNAGKAKPEFMGYADPELYKRRDEHARKYEEAQRG